MIGLFGFVFLFVSDINFEPTIVAKLPYSFIFPYLEGQGKLFLTFWLHSIMKFHVATWLQIVVLMYHHTLVICCSIRYSQGKFHMLTAYLCQTSFHLPMLVFHAPAAPLPATVEMLAHGRQCLSNSTAVYHCLDLNWTAVI